MRRARERGTRKAVTPPSSETRAASIEVRKLAPGVWTHTSTSTIEDARQHGTPQPSHALEELDSLAALGIEAETFYPGRGHTDDNIVVWFPGSQVLFGGCLVKAASATTLGYVADASIPDWPASIRATQQRFPHARIIVPGHGEPGGPELLDHTRALAEAAAVP